MELTNTYEQYVHTIKSDSIDLPRLRKTCLRANRYITEQISAKHKHDSLYEGVAPVSTKLFRHYNLLTFPADQIHALYKFISEAFRFVSKTTEPHWIQCWLNVYKHGEFIDWHKHWKPEYRSWHGYYGVNVAGSVTTYKIPGKESPTQVDVPNVDGQVIISPSANDDHRTWPWDKDQPRITIAFDIIPEETMHFDWCAPVVDPNIGSTNHNHWLPVL